MGAMRCSSGCILRAPETSVPGLPITAADDGDRAPAAAAAHEAGEQVTRMQRSILAAHQSATRLARRLAHDRVP